MNYAACLISAFDEDRTMGRRTAKQTVSETHGGRGRIDRVFGYDKYVDGVKTSSHG